MKSLSYLSLLIVLLAAKLPSAVAEPYIEMSAGFIEIDTPTASTRPSIADIRAGYRFDIHFVELAVMSSLDDDSLNQLTVDVPSVYSLFYRYAPYESDRLKIHLILGASQVEVDSTYPSTGNSSDTLEGVSFGIGFEEHFQSIPELSIKLDFIKLYKGDDLDINAATLGLRYAF